MKETILEIKESDEIEIDGRLYEGFIVKTTKQEIKFGIDAFSQCCEHFGHISSVEDVSEFIGAELYNITTTDKELITQELSDYESYRDTVFINLETSKGTLQLTVYNEHNGYYAHDIVCVSEDLNFKREL